VQGATYAVVKAQLPALLLLILIAVLVAGLFLSTLKTNSWRLPVIASGLWVVVALVGGVIYPAGVQALVVNPNQKGREEPYIRRNVLATRQALGIVDVPEERVSVDSVSTADLTDDLDPLRNVRLLNPGFLVDRFRTDQGRRSGLTIRDLDIDRYVLDGDKQQVLMAARELDLGTIANKSWQGRHLISTHGCGLVQAPAHRVEASGRPDYQEVALERPELYFGEALSGYAVVGTDVDEEACPGQTNAGPYSGDGGVALDSIVKRLSFALSFLDYNLIGSNAVDDDSSCCGSATCVTEWRRWRRSSRSTATPTRWSSTVASRGSSTGTPRAGGTRTPRTQISRSSATGQASTSRSTTSATA
jgi:uncharacterized membrane protein (UPF0182 family)